jgi:hypothetical protein
MYAQLADLVLYIHAAFVLYVILGFVLIVWGILNRWRWVRNFWFRLIHLLAIAVVTLQALCGTYCPLTVWENRLRVAAGQTGYTGSFIRHWVAQLLYYDLPVWFFAILYSAFMLLVVFTWIIAPPHKPWQR